MSYVGEEVGNANKMKVKDIALFDATDESKRSFQLNATTTDEKLCVMLFAEKKLKESIAWRGPMVMNTNA